MKKSSSSKYTARAWDFEEAFRYVFDLDGRVLEAGFFIHYLDGKYVKSVVELPVSYGCPIGCRHCASGAIDSSKQLAYGQIYSMYSYIHEDNDLSMVDKVLVTYSGIGEGALQVENIDCASKNIQKLHGGAYFNLSTVGYDIGFIDFCVEFAKSSPLHHVQITYLHHCLKQLEIIIPRAKKLGFDFEEMVKCIGKSGLKSVRINYVMIEGFNDAEEDWYEFIRKAEDVKEHIVVRVSKLNDTIVSIKNGLRSASDERIKSFDIALKSAGYISHIFFAENNNSMNCGQLSWEYKVLPSRSDSKY